MKMKSILALLLVFVLLAGCGSKTAEPSEPAEQPSTPAEPAAEAVSGLYFVNRADEGFLYELDPDTMAATPCVEKQIANPALYNGSLYYLNTNLQQIICMDVATGAEMVQAENVGWFRLVGGYLLFGKVCADVTESYFSVQALPDREVKELYSGNYSIPALCDGWVYYSAEVADAENPDNSTIEIRAYNCAKDETEVVETLSAARETVSRVYAVGNSAFYCVNNTDWHILSDGKLNETSWAAYLSEQVEPLYVDGDRMLYVFDGQCPDGQYRSRLCMQENGGETILLEGTEEGENVISATYMADGKWMVELHNAILQESDGQIHHTYTYYLLTAAGTLTPVTGI